MIKILILGGGFGGVRCALDLNKKIGTKAKITLIDKKSYHLFAPALYEVASAYGVKRDLFAVRLKKTICIPYSDIFENKKIYPVRGKTPLQEGSSADRVPQEWGCPHSENHALQAGRTSNGINFIQAEISSIDLENKKVATRGGEILDYDYLAIALGSQAANLGILGVKEYAFQFKSFEDALFLNRKMEELIKEVAARQRPQPIKITVVGAGFTGIEVATEFACYIKKLSKEYGIKGRCERMMLLEAGPRILPAVSDDERNIILKRLTRLGIEVLENVAAEEIESNRIKLKNGKHLDADLVIWTAGVRLPDLLEKTPVLPLTGKKKIKVNDSLEVTGLSNVFAIGDNTEFVDPKTGKLLPALAYIAVDQGKIAAKNISMSIDRKKLIEYNPFYSVWIAPVGGKYALAHLWGGINIKGFWGWVIREIVDLKYMLSILPVKRAISIMWQEITLFTKND